MQPTAAAALGTSLERRLCILEVLYDQRKTPVAQKVRIADEEKFDLKFHRLAKFQFVDRAGADEIALGPDADGFIGFPGAVINFAGIKDVDLGDFDLLMNLLLLEFRVLRLVERGGFFPGRIFEINSLQEIR